jgi:hypothetical protein
VTDPAAVKHGTNTGYTTDGCRCELCQFAHSTAMGLYQAKRRLTGGRPLSWWQQECVDDEMAYREGRQFYRYTGGRVVSAVIPRWVPDGWLAPARTVLEQLAAAAANGEQ